MSSIQERLQLKRVPLDTWNVREQLCLASAVVRSGDQNWMSVSRALKTVGEPNRPPDWYSQKSCAAQYGALLEHVETPKRKKRSSEGAVETPQESILKRLTQDRILEIQKTLADMNQQYEQLKNEIAEAHNPATTEERLQELWSGIEAAKRTRERENARRAAWLKERGERRARAERSWRPPSVDTASPTPPAPSSPLLTSLLKSSPVVTTPQHISHPATVVDTVSPSAGAPTLSMLLEKSGSTSPHEKHAAIEHIKSQLVQIEQQLKAGTSAPPPATLPAPPPAVDIDDIEIKAEDVYAFRDVDIHIPPQAALHRPAPRLTEKLVVRKEETPPIELVPDTDNMEVVEEEKVEPPPTESVSEDVVAAGLVMNPETPPAEPEPEQPATRQPTPEPEVKIAFPEVKFPTPEIKVIQPEITKYKEEIREVEPPPPEVKQEKQIEEEVERKVVEEVPVVQEEIVPELKEVEIELKLEPEDKEVSQTEATEEKAEELPPVPVETPLAREPTPDVQVEGEQGEQEPAPAAEPQPLQPEVPPEEPEVRQEAEVAPEEPPVEEVIEVKQKTEEELQKDEDAEDSIPLKEMMKEESLHAPQPQPKEEKQEVEETHNETDDDTPMELSREEEKDGKKKRDYSRKKKSDSRNRSGSESAEASAPESPSAGDAERQHRLWRKSVMLVYTRLCAHKYASLFLRPISDEEAPGYSAAVKRPMDLSAIRRNIDNGVIRTTAEFQRDVLLMLSNALMYNSSEHSVYSMAKEMFEEAQGQLGMLLAAQAHAGLEPPPRRKRKAAERH